MALYSHMKENGRVIWISHNYFIKLQALPNQLPWLDKMADKLQPAVNKFYENNGATQKVENALNGVWLGHPLHPVLTDIPIGAWMVAVTLDGLESGTGSRSFGKGADAAVLLGTVSSVATAAAGITDWQHLRHEPRRVGMLHALLNTVTLLIFGASIAARSSKNRPLGRKLALFGFSTLTLGAFFGGDLSYRLKVGTKHGEIRKHAETFVPIMNADELPEGQMMRVMVDELPVLLLRRGERVYAIAETCSHMGGPLAEGELLDDNTVVCPWHGSRFSLETGKVMDGPSAYSQTGYEARIFNQKVELRRME
jgi:nitrite reductase/ring-hydroxylating ferredoxin subunit/uncharacterized membrane protein